MTTTTDRYAVNDGGQLTVDGQPMLTLVRAAWGDDAPPAATLAAITDAIPTALNAAAELRAILWPAEDPDADWSADTLDAIAETLTRAGYGRPVATVGA